MPDSLLRAVQLQQQRLLAERKRRHRMMDVHAAKGVLIGVLILIGGAPGNVELNLGLWIRPVLAYLALLAGVLLFVGPRLYRGTAHGKLEVLGLVMTGLWDCALLVALLQTILVFDGDWVLCWPWELHAIPPTQPRLFAPAIFAALVAATWGIHLRAVLADRRDQAEDIQDARSA